MISRLIAWSARNLLLVIVGTVFAVAAGVYALRTLPLDAIPDLSDVQVIVYTDYPGQAPQVVEDQVTYPLTTAMLTVPKSKVVPKNTSSRLRADHAMRRAIMASPPGLPWSARRPSGCFRHR